MSTDTAKEKDLAEILETGPTDTSTFYNLEKWVIKFQIIILYTANHKS